MDKKKVAGYAGIFLGIFLISILLAAPALADDIETSILISTSEETDIATFGDVETNIYFTTETANCGDYNNKNSCEIGGCHWCSSVTPQFCGKNRGACQGGGGGSFPSEPPKPVELLPNIGEALQNLTAVTAQPREGQFPYEYLLFLLLPAVLIYAYREDIDKKLEEYKEYRQLKKKAKEEFGDERERTEQQDGD